MSTTLNDEKDWTKKWLEPMTILYPEGGVRVYRKKEAGYDIILIGIGQILFRVQVEPGEGVFPCPEEPPSDKQK